MSSDWPKVKLADYCDKIGSGATPRGGSNVYLDSGEISLVRSQNVYNHGFDYDGLVYIDEEAAEKLSNVELEANDVLINITGDSVARVCMVPDDVLPARVNQHVSILRPKKDSLDPRFLRYSLVNYENQYKLLAIASAGGTRKAITKGHLEEFEISLPDLAYQKKISEILSTFDQKIHLNQQTNATLEAMSQAIFKSWFVDFDPVRAKIEARSAGRDPNRAAMAAISACTKVSADGAVLWEETEAALDQKLSRMSEAQQQQLSRTVQLFPDELVESEIGEVPKGWGVKKLGDVSELNPQSLSADFEGEIEYINISGVNEGVIHETEIHDFKEAPSRARRIVKSGDVIWSNVRPNLKAYSLIVKPKSNTIASTGFTVIRPKLLSESFLYNYSTTENFISYLINSTEGSAYPAVKVSDFRRHKIIVPLKEIDDIFHELVWDNFEKIDVHRKQNITLSELRDTLLPKLISGELQNDN